MWHFLQLVVAATVEAALLVILSRLLFVAAFGLLGNRRSRRGSLAWHLLRLPGNLVHELSHAVVLWVSGFRISAVRLSILDPNGRGEVVARGRWHRLVPSTIGWAAASMAPLVGAIVVICALMHFFGVMPAWTVDPHSSVGEALLARWTAVLKALNLSAWQGWVFLLLVLSIGAELAPSQQDFRACLPWLIVAASLLCMAAAIFYAAPPLAGPRQWFDARATAALNKILIAEELALAVTGAAGLVLAIPALLREALAGDTLIPDVRAAGSSRPSPRPSPAQRRGRFNAAAAPPPRSASRRRPHPRRRPI